MQSFIAILFIAAAVAYAIRGLVNMARGKSGGCHCGTHACSKATPRPSDPKAPPSV